MNDEIRSLIREVCNEWVARGLPCTHAIHECFLDSTGDRGKYPHPLDGLAKLAMEKHPSQKNSVVVFRDSGDMVNVMIGGHVTPVEYSYIKDVIGDLPMSRTVPFYPIPGAQGENNG